MDFLDEVLKGYLDNEKYLICPTYRLRDNFNEVTKILEPKTREVSVEIITSLNNNNLLLEVHFHKNCSEDRVYLFQFVEKWYRTKSKFRIRIASGLLNLHAFHNLSYSKEIFPFFGIHYMDLSVRAFNVLKREGYYNVSDIFTLTESHLRNMDQLGEKSIREILIKIEELKKIEKKTS